VDLEVDCALCGTPLMAATACGQKETVEALLDGGARADATSKNFPYHTALQAAAWQESEETLRVLLDHGAEVNMTGGTFGSALCAAISEGSMDCTNLLLNAGADINYGGPRGTALELAIGDGSWSFVDLLLEQAIDVNAVSNGRHGTA